MDQGWDLVYLRCSGLVDQPRSHVPPELRTHTGARCRMSHTGHQTAPQAGRFALACLLFLWAWVPRSDAATSETSPNTVAGAIAAIEDRFDDLGVVEASYAVVSGDQET